MKIDHKQPNHKRYQVPKLHHKRSQLCRVISWEKIEGKEAVQQISPKSNPKISENKDNINN